MPKGCCVVVNSIEVFPGNFQSTANIIVDGMSFQRICFGSNTKDFAAKLGKVISTLPFACTLRWTKSGHGTSCYYFD